MADEKKCFVIMPITTPAPMVEKYRDGREHFHHVYSCLLDPSIRKAGYVPIPPSAKGSDLIHAGIIGNLESADLVLCDMSCLNPNVFFEFGIRTSLNKPVCIVKDELTETLPFDTTVLNHQQYSSKLDSWEIEAECTRLASHLTASATGSNGENTLWKYFGLSSKGRSYQVKEGSDGKLEYIAMQVESLAAQMNSMDDHIRVRKRGFTRSSKASISPVRMVLPSELGTDFAAFEGRTSNGARCILIVPDRSWDDAAKAMASEYVATAYRLPVRIIQELPDALLSMPSQGDEKPVAIR